MISDENHQALRQLATLKAKSNGHVLSTWKRTFHRIGSGAHCETCWRMAYVLIDVNPPVTNGQAIEEQCPKPSDSQS